ncbi:MAG: hypothetical protein K8R53_12965, partial [Bacteroidales bacterium]|nr:hypothetical protein [Bacteroidales bacterium]
LNFGDYTYVWSFEWNPIYTDFVAGLHTNNKIIVWSILDGSQLASASNVDEFGDICWSSDGEMLASASGGTLKIFAPFDLNGPEISINSPQDNFETINDHITLAGVITDDSEVSHAEYMVNSGSWTSLPLNTNNEFIVVVNLVPGSNTLSVRAFDIYGKTSSKSVSGTMLTDLEPPNIYGVSATPDEAQIGDPVVVIATVNDGWSGVNPNLVFCLVETPSSKSYLNYPMTGIGNDLFTATVSTLGFIEGNHIVHISAEDLEGNSDTLMNAVVFLPYDLPQISDINVSPDPIYTTDPVSIHSKIMDQSCIINAVLYWDDDPNVLSPVGYNMTMVNDSIFIASIPPHTEGDWYFIIEAMDGLGKINQSPVQSIQIFSLWQPVFMQLSVFLEGPFNGSIMNTSLNSSGYIPLSQPFNQPPWNYTGTESVTNIPNSDIVDWVLIELRETPGGPETAGNSTIIARKAAFLQKDGMITDVDESGLVDFGSMIITQKLFVVIWHRKHLGIMSNFPVPKAVGIYSYNFYDSENKVYGGALGHKEVNGIWVMISGDGNADMFVNNADKLDIWSLQAGNSGYYSGDYDLNGQVDNSDKIEKWMPNAGKGSQVPTNTAPTAVFNVSPANGTTLTNFNFDASGSYDPEDPPSVLQVRWDWENDGNWDTPFTTTKTATHQYTQPGTYTAKLEVKDSGGLTGTDTKSIEVTSSCPATVIHQGQTYSTVLIGNQCWLKENMNWETGTSWCYGNVAGNCTTYGRLYDWSTALTVCPSGWHLPTDNEWNELEGYVDSYFPIGDPVWTQENWRGFDAGINLKSTSGWNYNGNGTDMYGFTALPGGHKESTGPSFDDLGNTGYFWTSTEDGSNVWSHRMKYSENGVARNNIHNIANGFSVRCIMDGNTSKQPPSPPSNPSPVNGAIDQPINTNLSWTCTDPENDPLTYDVYFGQNNP